MKTYSTALSQAFRSLTAGFVIIGLFSLAINLMMLAGPLYMLQVYDRVLTSQSFETLVALSVLVGGIFAVSGFLDWTRIRILNRLGARFEARTGDVIFEAAVRRKVLGQDTGSEGYASDLSSYRDFISGSTVIALFDMPWVPVYLGVLFILHPYLGILGVVAAVVLFVLAVINDRMSRDQLQKNTAAQHHADDLFDTCMRNAEAMSAMGMQRDLRRRWGVFQTGASVFKTRAGDNIATFSVTAKTIRLALQSGMLGLGAALAISGHASPGIMIAATIILSRALAPVDHAVAQWRLVKAARGSYRKLKNLVENHPVPERQMSFASSNETLSVSIVQAGAPTATRASLTSINFKLEAGDVAAVIGPSGSGKSTLARLLVGVWHPQRGEVAIDGVATPFWNAEELGHKIGYLPQAVELFDGSVRDNISRFSKDASNEKILDAAITAGVHEMILQLPEGYETVIGNGGYMLSGGERQRIGLARALYGDPFLLVLDEPNANLDTTGDVALRKAVKSAKERGAIVVVITHRPSAMEAVNKVLVLEKGQQRAFGPKDAVLRATTKSVSQQRKVTHLQGSA
ncbi:MAG: type I secretion system permease/ATPase [Pseudomonadota bacterium]